MTSEAKYAKLNSFLLTDSDVRSIVALQLKKLVKKLEKKGLRCLIYARSKSEAKNWSENLGIGIYPNKGHHVIITLNDGTYGLNDLVAYNCICTVPPAPDRIPQMCGRLDRPGQKSDNLFLEYVVLKDTIDEGLLLRIDICNSFVHKYIMPLSKFYDLALGNTTS